ncbi:MAG: hypothetical protein GY866_03645 [Proteobacteria bacterium]|nr:hypothetical protein [Pseudomonadota bacterium]
MPNQAIYSETVLTGIAVIFMLIPSLTRILMSLSMLLYDLDEARHQEIVQELARR